MAAVDCTTRREREDRTIARAWRILEKRAKYACAFIDSAQTARDYLRLRLGDLEREEFWVVWLDAQHRVIEAEQMFVGTLTQTSVYPREIVKRALQLNAAAVILAHNHPSGIAEPSDADIEVTKGLKYALALVGVSVVDHFIVGTNLVPSSFRERGLL